MARIFLSHSSRNNFEAVALRDWLTSQGWDDVFLDLDPSRGIAAGERWERALHEAALRCEAVIFLVSADWLASGWCLKEYNLARGLNKKLFAVLIDPERPLSELPPQLTGTWQVIDLTGGLDLVLSVAQLPGSHEQKHVGFSADGLKRLKRGLDKAGLNPRFFAWPPDNEPGRAPYRGLKALEAEDAGIFFGRDAPIVEAIDRLRGLSAGASPRFFVILGASGAGKSSFLRAGLLPRLQRDDAHFLPLLPIRPEHDALYGENGLLRCLEAAFPDHSRAELRGALAKGAEAMRPLLRRMVAQAFAGHVVTDDAARPPTIVIAIDQAEELFRSEGAGAATALLELLRDLASQDDPAVLVIFAIRSDAYDALEHAKPLEGLPQATLPLLPMPRSSYKEVIEGPARRLAEAGGKLAIEPQLTEQVLADLDRGGGSDALPLLAFTMEQLYLEYRGAGRLRLADYDTFGKLKGAIDAAVERAFRRADGNPSIPGDRLARRALLRRGFIPWLAGIDPDSKYPRRNVARLSDIPAEALPLIGLLVEERLLTIDAIAAGNGAEPSASRTTTIEPAHEALLRQWGLLDGWLAEDMGLLVTLESVRRASRDWDANLRGVSWLAHQGQRLIEAQALLSRPDIGAKLDAIDGAYLAACRDREASLQMEADQRRREREEEQSRRLDDARKLARRTGAGLAVSLVLSLVAGGFGFYAQSQRVVADTKTRDAEEALRAQAQTLRDSVETFRNLTTDREREIRVATMAKSVALFRTLAQDKSNRRAQHDLAETLIRLGEVDFQERAHSVEWGDRLSRFEEALSIYLDLSKDPQDLEAMRGIGRIQGKISSELAEGRVKDPQRARSMAQGSVDVWRAVSDKSASPDDKLELASALALLAGDIGRDDRQRAIATRAEQVALLLSLVSSSPSVDAVIQLQWATKALARLRLDAGQAAEVREAYDRTLSALKGVEPGRIQLDIPREISHLLTGKGESLLASDPKAAREAFVEALAARRGTAEIDAGKAEGVAELLMMIGDVDRQLGDTESALKVFAESADILRRTNSPGFSLGTGLSNVLERIGSIRLDDKDWPAAQAAFDESLPLRRKAVEQGGYRSSQNLAYLLDCLAVVRNAQGDRSGARAAYDQSLSLRRDVVSKGESSAVVELIRSLSIVLEIERKADDQIAKTALAEMMKLNRAIASTPDVAEKRYLAGVISASGDDRFFAGDFASARAYYEQSILLFQELADLEKEVAAPNRLCAELEQAAATDLKLDDRDAALVKEKACLVLRRELARTTGDEGELDLLARTLVTIGRIALDQNDLPEVITHYGEALTVRRQLASQPGRPLALESLARLLVANASVKFLAKDFDGALEYHLEADRLIRTLDKVSAKGSLDQLLGRTVAGQAHIAIGRGEHMKALALLEEAVALFRRALEQANADDGKQADLSDEALVLGRLSFALLLDNQRAAALRAAEEALAIRPDGLTIQMNQAHALMALGRLDEARALYVSHPVDTVVEGSSWRSQILDDFAALRKAGAISSLMEEVESALAGKIR